MRILNVQYLEINKFSERTIFHSQTLDFDDEDEILKFGDLPSRNLVLVLFWTSFII